MKKIWFLILFIPVLFSCSDNDNNNKNPYIPNYPVNFTINTNLAAYSDLKYGGNSVIVPNYGGKGVIVFNTGIDTYNAFDAACPNQEINSCTAMTIEDFFAVCSCDRVKYNLYSGLGEKEYPLKQYRVEVRGTIIHVYN